MHVACCGIFAFLFPNRRRLSGSAGATCRSVRREGKKRGCVQVEEKGKWCHNGKRAAAARTYLRWGREGAPARCARNGTQGGGCTVKRTHIVLSKARQSWLSLRARLPLTASAHQRTAELTSVERLVSVKTMKKCHKLQNFESEDPLKKI